MAELLPYEEHLASAIIGVDTLWGGDVTSPSGMGRFIADCYFSGKPLPGLHGSDAAKALRSFGGVTSDQEGVRDAARRFMDEARVQEHMAAVAEFLPTFPPLRRRFVEGLLDSLRVMLDMAMEAIGQGDPVPYEEAVHASCGHGPRFVDPAPLVDEVRRALEELGFGVADDPEGVAAAVRAWRDRARVDISSMDQREILERLEELAMERVLPALPRRLRRVPLANVEFIPIRDAWFSGSMNYLGRARRPDGSPEYEATYEINQRLEISAPELEVLLAHEVVPGHVTTFAMLQHLYHVGRVGFEATILTMNTRASTLYEGIANNGLLLALGVDSVADVPDPNRKLAVLLSHLQDVAKNDASYWTWHDGLPREEVARRLRVDCLQTDERADKLANAWARHPLLGKMYLPSYHTGTELVASLLTRHDRGTLLPVLYGAKGLVDAVTILDALQMEG